MAVRTRPSAGLNPPAIVNGYRAAGASAAWALAEHGSVIVVERETSAGYHTTGRSSAQFLESYGNLSTRCLTRGARPFLEGPPDGFTELPLLSPRAALFFAREDQLGDLHARYTTVRALSPALRHRSGVAAGSSMRRFLTRHVRPAAARASCRCMISMPAMIIVPPSN